MQKKNNKIICHDKDGEQFEVCAEELTFRPSVYGVILQGNKVLLSRQWDGYDFPGGAVELGETIEKALIREVKEETGLKVKVRTLLTCADSFFKLPSTDNFAHSILMYYLCEVVGGEISIDGCDALEKEYMDKPEWVEVSKVGEVKHYNSIDAVEVIKKALKIIDYSDDQCCL